MAAQVSELPIFQPIAASRTVLRVATAGSVDDGKSTLIGRLLHDSKSLARDQLEQVERASKRRGHREADLSLVTDGLRAEREQGITIDVAWRYFQTANRRFILSDTPGHVQYTRNMVTGCSTADIAIVLVDARTGLKDQSRRHLAVAALVGVSTIIVAVNKMDLVGFAQSRFEAVEKEALAAAASISDVEVLAIPISALAGDNVVERSVNTPWYLGAPLLELLESLDATNVVGPVRFPVQWIVRAPDVRGYAGRLASGELHVGDRVKVLPSGETAKVERIDVGASIEAGRSAVVFLDRDVDVARGDIIVRDDERAPRVSGALESDLVWLSDSAPRTAGYLLKHGTRTVRAKIASVHSRLDVTTFARTPGGEIGPNEIARVSIEAAPAIAWDPYSVSRVTGSFILIDETTNDTVAAGMLR